MIEELVRDGVARFRPGDDACTAAERIDRIAELDRAAHMMQAALSVEMAVFAEQRRREDIADGVRSDHAGRGAAVEIAMARRVSKATIEHHLAFAKPLLADHPRLLEACLEGEVSQPAAKNVVKACEVLEPDQRRAIDADLAALAKERTPGQLIKDAARMVAATDPDVGLRRAVRARADKNIRSVVNGDGTGTLIATLPVEQAIACSQTLDHTARGLRGDGDRRSIRELTCDLFVERITGQTKATDPAARDRRRRLRLIAARRRRPARQAGRPPRRRPRGPARGTGPRARHQRQRVVAPARLRSRRRHAPVDGPREAPFRGLATQVPDLPRRHLAPALLGRPDPRHRPHHQTYRRRPTIPSNGEGLATSDHPIRDLPGWTVQAIDGDAAHGVRWTTPTGHTYTSRPPPILGIGNTRRAIRRE